MLGSCNGVPRGCWEWSLPNFAFGLLGRGPIQKIILCLAKRNKYDGEQLKDVRFEKKVTDRAETLPRVTYRLG